MAEITYLPEVECVAAPGILANQLAVGVAAEDGRVHYLQVGSGQVARVGPRHYLAVGLIELDYRGKRALIELPTEADSGTNRFWVPFARFRAEANGA